MKYIDRMNIRADGSVRVHGPIMKLTVITSDMKNPVDTNPIVRSTHAMLTPE